MDGRKEAFDSERGSGMADNGSGSEQFSALFEELVSAMAVVNSDQIDVGEVKDKLNRLAALLRLSKGVTHTYSSPADEKSGRGETIISYDNGKSGRPVHTVRIETSLMSITTMTVYMADDEPDLTDEELARADLVMRTALVFISRNRLQDIAYQFAFYDDQGYRSIRSFFKYLVWNGKPGAFDGMVAANYNFRHFSLVNDKYGREAGDRVLRNHYDCTQKLIGKNGILCRLGGDNFVCIFPREKLEILMEYFRHADVPYDSEGHTIRVSAYVGVFVIPDGYTVTDPNSIMGKVMLAYRVAQAGVNDHIVFYDDELMEGREQAMSIQQQFPGSLEKKEFVVFFQPKVNAVTGEIRGAEALCRWFRDGNIVPPMEFIPVLERSSDICMLDFYVLDRVCGYIRKWLDEGRHVVRISVNFSRKHIVNEHLHEDILGIVDRHRIPHEFIEIELTETTTDVEFRALQRIVGRLQKEGICTSVDDFGMGYSSLNLIRVIPWNVLKVDRCFLPLGEEENSSVNHIMFRNVIRMAKEMGLETIVEGVETGEQLQLLRDNKCDLAQGFLFDRPLPVEEFEKRLDMHKYTIEI